MKKNYIGKEIFDDIEQCLGVSINFPNVDNFLTIELYSEIYEKPNPEIYKKLSKTELREVIDQQVDQFLFDYAIPMIDYSGHLDKEIIILDETDPLYIKVIDSFNYNINNYNKIKDPDISQNTKNEISTKYNKEVLDKAFDFVRGRDSVTQICIVDFNFKSLTRMQRN